MKTILSQWIGGNEIGARSNKVSDATMAGISHKSAEANRSSFLGILAALNGTDENRANSTKHTSTAKRKTETSASKAEKKQADAKKQQSEAASVLPALAGNIKIAQTKNVKSKKNNKATEDKPAKSGKKEILNVTDKLSSKIQIRQVFNSKETDALAGEPWLLAQGQSSGDKAVPGITGDKPVVRIGMGALENNTGEQSQRAKKPITKSINGKTIPEKIQSFVSELIAKGVKVVEKDSNLHGTVNNNISGVDSKSGTNLLSITDKKSSNKNLLLRYLQNNLNKGKSSVSDSKSTTFRLQGSAQSLIKSKYLSAKFSHKRGDSISGDSIKTPSAKSASFKLLKTTHAKGWQPMLKGFTQEGKFSSIKALSPGGAQPGQGFFDQSPYYADLKMEMDMSDKFKDEPDRSYKNIYINDLKSSHLTETAGRKAFTRQLARQVSRQQMSPQAKSSAEQSSAWKHQRLVFKDGKALHIAARSLNGALQLQLDAGGGELGKLLHHHLQEIQQHVQQQLNVEIDLQLQNYGGQQQNQQSKTFSSKKTKSKSGSNEIDLIPESMNGPDTAQVRYFGFNSNEWTA